MTQVTIHEAKTHLSRLIEKVLRGEKVVIAKRQTPLVQLERVSKPLKDRRVGGLKGMVRVMGTGFERPVPDMEVWMNLAAGKQKKSKSRRP